MEGLGEMGDNKWRAWFFGELGSLFCRAFVLIEWRSSGVDRKDVSDYSEMQYNTGEESVVQHSAAQYTIA